MNFYLFKFLTLFCCFYSLSLFAQGDITDSTTGVSFPGEVSFEKDGKKYNLQATGVATRKKFFVKVYSIASYLQTGAPSQARDKFMDILQSNKAKQLTMKWVHDASVDKIQDAYRDAFKNSIPVSEYNQLQGPMDNFIGMFNQDAQKGDEYVIRWLPGGYIEVLINGNQVGSLTNEALARGIWNIWFGPKSVVDRAHLVSQMR